MLQNKGHIEHLEDLVFTGKPGIKTVLFVLEELKNHFTAGHSQLHITTKWDGSPAIVCGLHPQTNNFFVGTKSVFNQEAKINYNIRDIHANHGHNKVLEQKLWLCLEYLPELNIKGVLQGDMMYSHSELKKTNSHVIFKPNVVEYKVPRDTTLGRRIENSLFGIVFHTTYGLLGETSYKVDIGSLTPSHNVWFRDASLVNAVGPQTFFEYAEYDDYKLAHAGLKKLVRQLPNKFMNTFEINETIKTLTKRYLNDTIRKGKIPEKDGTSFSATAMANFAYAKLGEEIDEAKKLETKQNRALKREAIMDWIYKENFQHLEKLFYIYEFAISCKNLALSKLNQMKDIDTGDFIPEGYVVSTDDFVVKLVDRPKFSFDNFNQQKDWQ